MNTYQKTGANPPNTTVVNRLEYFDPATNSVPLDTSPLAASDAREFSEGRDVRAELLTIYQFERSRRVMLPDLHFGILHGSIRMQRGTHWLALLTLLLVEHGKSAQVPAFSRVPVAHPVSAQTADVDLKGRAAVSPTGEMTFGINPIGLLSSGRGVVLGFVARMDRDGNFLWVAYTDRVEFLNRETASIRTLAVGPSGACLGA